MITKTDVNATTTTPKLIPRPYQITGIEYLKRGRRVFLKDWPGLGKTLQASEAAELPCLVVCPAHLVLQWGEFLQEQYPELKIAICVGTRSERDKILDSEADFYVVNYSMLHSYAFGTYKTIIFDESHHLRNRSSKQAKAAAILANKKAKDKSVPRVYMLSASPMWKQLDDIWMQLHILYPKLFTSYHEFVKMFFVTDSSPWGPKVLAVKKTMRKELDDMIAPIMFGRSYKDVGRQLPPVIENVVTLDLSPEMRKFYLKMKKDYRIQFIDEDGELNDVIMNHMSVLYHLRQVTMGGGKVAAIQNLIEDNNVPTLIFTWYKDHADMIFKGLSEGSAVKLSGDDDPVTRHKTAQWAQRHKKHIIATIASFTEGENLSEYRQVIFAEEHYPPGSNFQALSRVVRDRNSDNEEENNDPVTVHYIHVKNTIDQTIHKVSRRREANIKDVIKGALI